MECSCRLVRCCIAKIAFCKMNKVCFTSLFSTDKYSDFFFLPFNFQKLLLE
uniref:Uncharacterized protein n=1 Tax=Anguilla anguilla TaxID=7936 RepID=A0A0E9WMH6_ANGAN